MLQTGAYWRMLNLRDDTPKPEPWPRAAFTTLRARLLKIAVRIAVAAACPEAALFASFTRWFQSAGS